MNYVESYNLFGVESRQIPCMKASGAPTSTTEGAVGCLYMDTDNGDLYKCKSVSNGVYEWVSAIISVDDTIVGDSLWSSKHIVDKFYPISTETNTPIEPVVLIEKLTNAIIALGGNV